MREPRPIPGVKTPLFDRLLDDGYNVRQPVSSSRVIDLPTFRELVRRDLVSLLNTRSNLRGTVKQLAEGTVIDFGIPNLAPISPAAVGQRDNLSAILQKIVSTYERRLTDVRVVLQQDKANPRALIGVIYANLVFGNITEPVYFPLALDNAARKVDVLD